VAGTLNGISGAAERPGAYLGALSWPEAEERLAAAPVVILPFGAGAKEHGPHLPMDVDRRVMDYLLARAVASQPVLVAPPILHGWFPACRARRPLSRPCSRTACGR
jgi:hypothetical protein